MKTARKLNTAQLLSLGNYITLHKDHILKSGMDVKALANKAQEELKIYITPSNVHGVLSAMGLKLTPTQSAPRYNPLARIMEENALIKEQLKKVCSELQIEYIL